MDEDGLDLVLSFRGTILLKIAEGFPPSFGMIRRRFLRD